MSTSRNAFAAFSRDELVELLGQIAQQLAGQTPPALISGELAPVVEGRSRYDLAIPQWSTTEGQSRGVRIQAWSYEQRRQAEQAATDRRPTSPTFGQIDDWRRMAEEVRLGIVEPAGLTIHIVERWGYDVVTYIHRQIERLGPLPPALLAAELAALAGAPPPPRPGAPDPGGCAPESDPDELGSSSGAGAGLA